MVSVSSGKLSKKHFLLTRYKKIVSDDSDNKHATNTHKKSRIKFKQSSEVWASCFKDPLLKIPPHRLSKTELKNLLEALYNRRGHKVPSYPTYFSFFKATIVWTFPFFKHPLFNLHGV